MGRLIIIKKINHNESVHYYAVYKNESFDTISYYMGLDSLTRRILFFKNNNFSTPNCIYDLQLDKFSMEDSNLKPRIGAYVIIKAMNAIKNNVFPEDISWQS